MTKRITIRRPDDWHLHVRDGAMLAAVLPCTARHFARAIIMPNLVPPVVTAADAIAYRTRILAALPEGAAFTPLMTCYLTDTTDPDDLEHGFRGGVFAAAKLYPAYATTNSASGVTDIAKAYPVFARMEEIGMPLLMHGEDVAHDVDVFDRERVFIDRTLLPLLTAFPGLRMVLEHLSTKEAVEVVRSAAPQLAGTITPHHLTETRTDMLGAGLRPDLYCMPVIKTAADRTALRQAATSGAACFFLGTDSAPHQVARKYAAVCSAGVFNAPVALAIYAQVFEEESALDRLEAFASLNGPRHYRLAPNEGTITLERTPWTVPDHIGVAGVEERVTVYHGGESLPWRVVEE
jgi:dihydroorotase